MAIIYNSDVSVFTKERYALGAWTATVPALTGSCRSGRHIFFPDA